MPDDATQGTLVPPKNEHIFQATIIEPLVLQWQTLIGQAKSARDANQSIADEYSAQASNILERIICLSRNMLARLAQYEKYTNTVELETLLSAAQARIPVWLTYWDPTKGKLFSWLSKCAKNVFLNEVVRESNRRKRLHATGDNLERFAGVEDHGVVANEAAEELKNTLGQMTCRWGDPQSLLCIRFHIACLVENPTSNKKRAIRAGAYASGLSLDLSKYFYTWALVALRDVLYAKIRPSYTDEDLLRLRHTHTFIPDLFRIFPRDLALKFIQVFNGCTIKVPTLAQIRTCREESELFLRVTQEGYDPDSVARVARAARMSPASAQEVYERMAVELDGSRDSETSLYS